MRDDDEFPEFEAGGEYVFAEAGEVVLVGVSDFLDQAVDAQTFQQTGNLAAVLGGQESAERLVLKAIEVSGVDAGGHRDVIKRLLRRFDKPGEVTATYQR